jgi:hypothetical protein
MPWNVDSRRAMTQNEPDHNRRPAGCADLDGPNRPALSIVVVALRADDIIVMLL